MIRPSTRWNRKERVNVESGLEIVGTKHFTITGAPAYTHFSCFIQPNLQTGLFIGSQTIASLGLVSGVWNFVEGIATGTQIGGNGDEDYLISNLVLFDSAQSYEENEFIRVQGGLLRESSHIDCVAHYPLTQRQYQKASASFIVKHPQFSLNDLVALDVVEQYNYAKSIPLMANHGKLVNFTDSDVNVSPTSSIKDFHNKNNLKSYFSKFNGVDSKVSIPHNANLTFGDGAGNNISFTITGHIIPSSTNAARVYEKGQENSVANRQVIISTTASGNFQFIIFTASVLILSSPITSVGKKYSFAAIFDSTAPSVSEGMRFIIFENGVPFADLTRLPVAANNIVASLETTLIGAGDNVYSDMQISDIRVHSEPITIVQVQKVLLKGEDSGLEISGWGLNSEETLQNAIIEKDLYGANDGTLNNLIRGVETSSLFPELRNTINCNGGTTTITGTGTGIGLFIKTEAAITLLSNLVSGLSAITEYRVNGNLVADEAALVLAVNDQKLIHLHIKCTVTNPVIQAFNGHIGLAYISNDKITLKDIYKNVNNLLIANPFINEQVKFNNYYSFNEIINTNEIADLIGSSNAVTAATVFKEINELR